MTRITQTEENNFCDSIIIANVWHSILQFYVMALGEKLVSFYDVN